MSVNLDGKISIGRYNNGKCFVELMCETQIIVLAEIELEDFAKAITGMGERPAKLELYSWENKLAIKKK